MNDLGELWQRGLRLDYEVVGLVLVEDAVNHFEYDETEVTRLRLKEHCV